jgi:quercetin dioxygenase-like cupin family protein
MHPSAQQLLLVIAGALTVEVEAQGKALLEAGEAVIIPADLVHLARNESTTAAAKALVVHSRACAAHRRLAAPSKHTHKRS